ncbi:MAG: isochorismatase [Dehalococcoidia bacterium]|nr:MAG: isochorismatase [Dehalococcoidia bacterium]
MDLSEALTPSKTALLVVDVQNYFCHPDGAIGRRGNDLSGYQQMVEQRLLPLIAAARRVGVAVVLTRMEHDFWTVNPAARDLAGRATLPYGDEDQPRSSDRPPIHSEAWERAYFLIERHPEDLEITKPRASAFLGTPLDLALRGRGIERVLVTGVATNVCVESTARDAFQYGYRVFFVRDCTATRSAAAQRATEVTIHKFFGTVVDSAAVIAAWQQPAGAASASAVERWDRR